MSIWGISLKISYAGTSKHENMMSGKFCFIILGMSWVGLCKEMTVFGQFFQNITRGRLHAALTKDYMRCWNGGLQARLTRGITGTADTGDYIHR